MMKKKAKGKAAAKKDAKKNHGATRRSKKKELDPVGTWKDVAMLVESRAKAMAVAVIEEGEKGQVSPVKFLFEVAKIGPPPEGADSTEEEESLAKTLFRTLNIPMTPLAADQYDAEDTVVIAANVSGQKEKAKGEENDAEAGKIWVGRNGERCGAVLLRRRTAEGGCPHMATDGLPGALLGLRGATLPTSVFDTCDGPEAAIT